MQKQLRNLTILYLVGDYAQASAVSNKLRSLKAEDRADPFEAEYKSKMLGEKASSYGPPLGSDEARVPVISEEKPHLLGEKEATYGPPLGSDMPRVPVIQHKLG